MFFKGIYVKYSDHMGFRVVGWPLKKLNLSYHNGKEGIVSNIFMYTYTYELNVNSVKVT